MQRDGQKSWLARVAHPLRALTGFHKFMLGLTIGLMVTGVITTLVTNPVSMTRAPRAHMDMLVSLDVGHSSILPSESVPSLGIDRGPSEPAFTEVLEVLSYDFNAVATGSAAVPPIFLTAIPKDLSKVSDNMERKLLFFKSVLPLILRVNEELLADRNRLILLRQVLEEDKRAPATERLWLAVMSDSYGTRRDDINALLEHVDIVPPSMALAQAAAESGWGSSRFAIMGNALFGQWTYTEGNLVPSSRDAGEEHMVKRFNSLIDSVRGYALNLNTHRAYREFRKLRAELRKKGKPIDGAVLIGALHRYSERGMDYVAEIRSMIRFNKLNRLDDARLDDGGEGPAT